MGKTPLFFQYIQTIVMHAVYTLHTQNILQCRTQKKKLRKKIGAYSNYIMIFKFHEFHVNSCYIIIIFIFGCKFSFHATFTCHSWVSLMGQASKFLTRSSSMAQFSSTFKSSTWHAKLHLDILAIGFYKFLTWKPDLRLNLS